MQLLTRVFAGLFELDLRVVRSFVEFPIDLARFGSDLGVGFVDGAAGVFDLDGGVNYDDILLATVVCRHEQYGRSWSQLFEPILRPVSGPPCPSSPGLLAEQMRRLHHL